MKKFIVVFILLTAIGPKVHADDHEKNYVFARVKITPKLNLISAFQIPVMAPKDTVHNFFSVALGLRYNL